MSEIQAMPRRTIYLPDTTEELVREHAREGESFSATIVRLIELGVLGDELDAALDENEEFPLGYIGAGKGGPPDLAINAEKYLGLEPWGPGEGPSDGPDDQDPR
jgi:hypothetical protein